MTNIDLITDPEMDLLGRATQLGEEIKGMFTDAMSDRQVHRRGARPRVS